MWSDADKLLLNATPRIFSELSRVVSGSGSGRVFKFPRLLSQNRTSLGLDLLPVALRIAQSAGIGQVVHYTPELNVLVTKLRPVDFYG